MVNRDKSHHPPHIYLANTWYAISVATVHHRPLLADNDAKVLVSSGLLELHKKQSLELLAWVVLDDHYHALLKTTPGQHLGQLIGRLHGTISYALNRRTAFVGRQVWHNYWDTCIRSDADLWTRFNYIHLNPVKHGYVQRPEDWEFSSCRRWLADRGREWMEDCLRAYPVVDFLGDESEVGTAG